jgi:hypothetical protein
MGGCLSSGERVAGQDDGGAAVAPCVKVPHEGEQKEPLVRLKEGSSAFYVLRQTDDVLEKYLVLEELGSGQVGSLLAICWSHTHTHGLHACAPIGAPPLLPHS